jgi:phage terminase large subunit
LSASQRIQIECADKLGVLLQKPKRIKILVGGRASTKSTFVADVVLARVSGGQTWCCGREYQNSIDDSVHSLLRDEIERCGFTGFHVGATEITHDSGGRIFYRGLARNITSLKGINAHGLWNEEGESLSDDTLRILTASIRVSAKDVQLAKRSGLEIEPREIWITMNRGHSKDPVSLKFLRRAEKALAECGYYEDDAVMIVQINYTDNPWFLESGLEQERLDDLEHMSPAAYEHKWLGAYADSVDGSIIKPEWFDACIDAHLQPHMVEVFRPLGAIIAAHDPSGEGNDSKGFAVRHGSVILQVEEMTTGDIDDGCDWATRKAIDANADWFVWDGDGMGAGLKRQVSNAFYGKHIKFHMFRGSLSGIGQDNAKRIYQPVYGDEHTKPKTFAETFKNNRSQYYTELANRCYNTYRAVVKGQYVDPARMVSFASAGIPNMPGLRSELCRIPQKDASGGLIQIMSKADMKKLGIDSPNMADSVMMSLFAPQPVAVFEPINYPGESVA